MADRMPEEISLETKQVKQISTCNEAPSQGDEFVLYDFPGKTRSVVWKYFGFVKKAEGPPIKANLKMETAICKLCKKSYANKGNTTNLLFHIDHDHKGNVPAVDQNNNIKKPPAQRTITDVIANPGRLSQKTKTNLDDALLKLIVGKALPISLVKNSHFVEFARLLDPRYKLPSQPEVVKSLNNKKDQMRSTLLNDLRSVSDISITHDSWTSCATESYSAVTAHFIDDKWNLKSAVLQTKKMDGSHTSEKIAESLKEVQREWNLPKLPILVTDNAANERKAAELLGWTRFGCYGHRINLVVKHALEVPELSKILAKSRRLVTFFHQSTSATDALVEKQKLVFSNTPGLIGHKLVTDVPTRWNSSLAMLDRLAEQLPAIMSLIFDTSLNKTALSTVKTFCLTSEEHSVVQELISVLKPFETATTILCAESTPTMHKVLPCIAKISKKLEEVKDNPLTSPVVKKVILRMQEELLKRTQVEDVPLLAALLSPDTKNLIFLTPEEQVSAQQMLMNTALNLKLENDSLSVVKIKQEEETIKANVPDLPKLPDLQNNSDINLESDQLVNVKSECENEGPSKKKIKLTDLDEWFDDVCFTGESKQPLQNVIELEVHRYLAHNQAYSSKQQTLLQWWQTNELFYPRLATLAKKYLAIPASSVPSERVFSLAGIVVDKKRSRLKPAMVDTLIFMKMNMDTYW